MEPADDIVERLAGQIRSVGDGSPVVLEYRSPTDFVGLTTTNQLRLAIGALGGLAADRDCLDGVVFLDLETTGLSAGAGMLVFLVGLAFLDGSDIVIEQFFLHDPAVELSLLRRLAERLAGYRSMVTFNGKSFDGPMLVGRYDLHQLADPLPSGHVDLLHPSRRIWSRRLGRTTLGTLEARILGVTRQRDVSGAEIPALYFSFLRGGSVEALASVLSHNRDDLLAMIRLTDRIGAFLSDPRLAELSDPNDLLGLGALFESLGRREEARDCYTAALVGADAVERAEALFRIAKLLDRAVDLDRAIDLLIAVANYPYERALSASIELAKIYEHKTRDHKQALIYAERALGLIARSPPERKAVLSFDVTHRIARLQRKVAARAGSGNGARSVEDLG